MQGYSNVVGIKNRLCCIVPQILTSRLREKWKKLVIFETSLTNKINRYSKIIIIFS